MIGEFYSGARALYHLSDATDSSGRGNTLTNLNTATFVAGRFGNAVSLNGTNQALVLTNHFFSAAQLANLTISFWVKLNAEIASGSYRFVEWHTDKVTSTSGMLQLIEYQYNTGAPQIYFLNNLSVTPVEIFYPITLGINNWYHIAYVKSGTTKLEAFVNGKQVGANTGSGTDNGGDTGYTYDIAIGTSRNANGAWANSKIDELAVFERALTAREVKDYYSWVLGRKTGVV